MIREIKRILNPEEVVLFILIYVGYLIMLISASWIVFIAFKESLKCGLLYICIPFYSLYYIITRWSKTREPFIIHLIGWLIFFMAL